MQARSMGRRVARLEDAVGASQASYRERQLREAERLVRGARKMVVGDRKPVRGDHSLDTAVAFLLVAGEERHRDVLGGVAREALERQKSIGETGVLLVAHKWWDERELFSDWVWQAVELGSAGGKAEPRQAALELSLLRAGVSAFSEPTRRDRLVKDDRPLLLIDDSGPEAPEPPEV